MKTNWTNVLIGFAVLCVALYAALAFAFWSLHPPLWLYRGMVIAGAGMLLWSWLQERRN